MTTIALPPRPPRKRIERDIVREILVALNRIPDVRATRNNVGRIEDSRGVPVTFGLGEGSPDLVGVITFGGPSHPFAIAFAIEVKQPGRYPTRIQRAWHKVAARRGMLTETCRDAGEAVDFVTRTIETIGERIGRWQK